MTYLESSDVVCLFGGVCHGSAAEGDVLMNDVWCLVLDGLSGTSTASNIATNESNIGLTVHWERVAIDSSINNFIPSARSRHTSIGFSDRMFIFGGFDEYKTSVAERHMESLIHIFELDKQSSASYSTESESSAFESHEAHKSKLRTPYYNFIFGASSSRGQTAADSNKSNSKRRKKATSGAWIAHPAVLLTSTSNIMNEDAKMDSRKIQTNSYYLNSRNHEYLRPSICSLGSDLISLVIEPITLFIELIKHYTEVNESLSGSDVNWQIGDLKQYESLMNMLATVQLQRQTVNTSKPCDQMVTFELDLGEINMGQDQEDHHQSCFAIQGSKELLSIRCNWLKTMLSISMIESTTNKTKLNDTNFYSFLLLFIYFYTDVIVSNDPNTIFGLLELSTMYDVPLLANRCEGILIREINSDNVIQMLEYSNNMNLELLKMACYAELQRSFEVNEWFRSYYNNLNYKNDNQLNYEILTFNPTINELRKLSEELQLAIKNYALSSNQVYCFNVKFRDVAP